MWKTGLRLRLATGVVESALRADEFALAPFEHGSAVDTVLPIMILVSLRQLVVLDFRYCFFCLHEHKLAIRSAEINPPLTMPV